MTDQEFIKYVQEYINKNNLTTRISIKKHKEFLEFCKNYLSSKINLIEDLTLKHLKKLIDSNNVNSIKCQYNNCKNLASNYKSYIIPVCKEHLEFKNLIRNKKIKESNIKTFKIKKNEIIEKRKQTCLIKYGVNHQLKSKKIQKKIKKTNFKRYGVDNPMKVKKFKEKAINTWKINYNKFKNNLIFSFQSKETQNKIKKTNLEKYGAEYPFKSKEIQEKIKQTNLNKYKVIYPFQSKEIQKKIKEKFLILNPSQRHLKNLDKLNKEYIEKNFLDKNKVFKLNEFMKFYNYSQPRAYQILEKFNIEYNKIKGYSQSEKEIANFIKEIYSGEIIENSRKIISPYELDIYIPEKNLAIEFNGLFWHSIESKELINEFKYKHLKKTKEAEDKNINLLHIFENEWVDPRKQEIWKSVISYKLGVINKKYYARKLRVIEINSKESAQFFEENHLQGNASAGIRLALVDNNEIISVMTFSKPRYNKQAEYELIRFASKKFTACVGCAQKLFKHFIEKYQPKSVISYANRRWAYSKSNIYQKLEFEFIGESEPNYFYFKLKDMILYPRVKFQKHKLKNYKDISYDPSLTETEIMFNSGYRRIYDAGNLIYLWKRKSND